MQWNEILGFHATWRSVADKLKDDVLCFKPGSQNWDWLGTGVYFWIESYRMAELWANKLLRSDPARAVSDPPVIMKCKIQFGLCLNLADTSDIFRIEKFSRKALSAGLKYSERNELGGVGHPLHGEAVYRYLDHKLIDDFCDAVGSVDTVLGVFNNGPPIFSGSNILRFSSMQLSVRERAVRNITVEQVIAL